MRGVLVLGSKRFVKYMYDDRGGEKRVRRRKVPLTHVHICSSSKKSVQTKLNFEE